MWSTSPSKEWILLLCGLRIISGRRKETVVDTGVESTDSRAFLLDGIHMRGRAESKTNLGFHPKKSTLDVVDRNSRKRLEPSYDVCTLSNRQARMGTFLKSLTNTNQQDLIKAVKRQELKRSSWDHCMRKTHKTEELLTLIILRKLEEPRPSRETWSQLSVAATTSNIPNHCAATSQNIEKNRKTGRGIRATVYTCG